MTILVTGGAGFIGSNFVLDWVAATGEPVVNLDKLTYAGNLANLESLAGDKRHVFVRGDICDRAFLDKLIAEHRPRAVVHFAAESHVDRSIHGPGEFVQTNIVGSQNVIEACIDSGVKKVVALSTDKASSPINLYGATKLTADKLFVSGNHYAAHHVTRFSVVRYGNVMGSRGSVIPFFRKLADQAASLPITDFRCTRFFITLPQAVKFVVDSFDIMQGGELFVPRIPSMRIVDLADAIAPGTEMHDVGLRPGEKLHEEMISPEEGRRALRVGDRYVLQPVLATWGYRAPTSGEPLPDGFAYRSDENDEWFTTEQITTILKTEC